MSATPPMPPAPVPPAPRLPEDDLQQVLARCRPLFESLRSRRIFITGGTGFFGIWLLETFAWANDRLGLGARAVVLTRDVGRFRAKAPHLAYHPAIAFHSGDVATFEFPPGGFSHVIHAATESYGLLNEHDPLRLVDASVWGTRRVLELARTAGAGKFLLTSSGAVYGRQPPGLSHLPEDYAGGPDPTDVRSAYAEGKRMAELLCAVYAKHHGVEAKIARCFAFVGPHLPLDAHFAIGNFIRDALTGGPVRVGGDGTPFRSYLYAADLAAWLWTILIQGQAARPYNVGSDQAVRITELAGQVAEAGRAGGSGTSIGVTIAQPPGAGPAQRYVPCIERARGELGLNVWTSLGDSLRKTMDWHGKGG